MRCDSHHVTSTTSRRSACHRAASLILLSIFVPAGCASNEPSAGISMAVAIPDRTSLAEKRSWQVEVKAQTQEALEAAVAEGVDRVELIAIGSNTDQAATVASGDFNDIEGNTAAKQQEARDRRIEELSTAAAQIASEPVETDGSDLFAAMEQAASLCNGPEVTQCSILMLSDMEDQRVLAAPSAEAAIDDLSALMPDLSGISVHVSGLGASGADAATVQKVKAAWTGLLEQAGAVDIRIARSL